MTDTYSQMLEQWTLDTFWARVEALDWFATAPNEVREQAKAFAQSLFTKGQRESLFATLAVYAFDTECIYGSGANHTLSYSTRIRAILHAAGDPLPLTDLGDATIYDDNRDCIGTHIHFLLDGQRYEYRVEDCDDYFDAGVITRWLNPLLKARGSERQFHVLPADDQIVKLAFVREATYRQAAREGLLPHPDYFMRQLRDPDDWETLVKFYDYLLEHAPPEEAHMDIYDRESRQFLSGNGQSTSASTGWILERIAHEEPHIRSIAVDEAGKSTDPSLFDDIVKALHDPDERVRLAAVNAFRQRGDPRAIEPLINALNDPSLNVLRSIVVTLQAFKDERAYMPLLALLTARPEIARQTSALREFLSASGSELVVDRCIDLLTHANQLVREEAIAILSLMRSSRAFEPLVEVLLNDPIEEVRSRSMRAVAITGGAAALQPLLQAFECVQPGTFPEYFLWNALGYELKEVALDPMLEWLEGWETHRRHFAARVLGTIDHPRSHAALEGVLHDVDTLLADLAAVRLGHFGKVVAFERIAEIAQDDLNPFQPNALHALASFGADSFETIAVVLEAAQESARKTVIGTLVSIGGEGAIALLLKYRADAVLRDSVKQALNTLGYKGAADHEA